ncbi:IS66 family insertion sequence element accessory protein TnpB [Massilia niastensis]|uniref:IS66 family insertion sequence element accessory protein TnpB n=1 Tax=Massilia niastensis TaxID=544911 RepID=UPI0035315748
MGAGLSALAAKVETALQEDRYSGHVFVFRGRRGDLITVLVLGDTFWYAGL